VSSRGARGRYRPRGAGGAGPVRSVRISDETWAALKERAAAEGVTASWVLGTLAEGYVSGDLRLPQIVEVWPE
jgi:predicted DNA-binding ribbon-helix-helix protein